MKKSVFFLTLLLCLSLILPGAHAEDTYVPGERMRSLVSSPAIRPGGRRACCSA